MGIVNPFRNDTENLTDPTIEPTIYRFNQATRLGHSDQNNYPLGSLDSDTDLSRSGRNIDNRTGMNPHGTIVTTTQESNRAKNYDIFN